MEKISVHDVRRLCDAGVFRAFAEGTDIYLEETDTGNRVLLTTPAEREQTTARRAKPHSRTERMFGSRETWNTPAQTRNPDDDQGPYRGFLMVRCEECGGVKAYNARRETYSFKCSQCGHETPLEKLRPMFMHCKCGKDFRYKTNLTDKQYTHICMGCGTPVDMEVNSRGTAYVTIGERR